MNYLNFDEPNQGNIRKYLDNLYSKFQPIEQSRWNQSNIDTLFYAGSQKFVNQHFNFQPGQSYNNYYFNLIQQPINMVTGYQRQHRKSITYIPSQGGDSQTTDQYTALMMNQFNINGLNEQFSKACEQSAVSGMVLLQPYLDYTSDDPAQGKLSLKVWEYNSFLVDPYFRNQDMSDAQFVWCQEYISKKEAEERFPDQQDKVKPMMGSPQRYGNFYFLPENHNMSRNDLFVLSYVWSKSSRERDRLYSKSQNQFFDYAADADIELLMSSIPDLEVVKVKVPTWKLSVVLNDQLMYQGENPLGFDDCPFIPVIWNYEPHINQYDLRVRSLVRTMRDPQFLMNHKIITNNDIAAATINAGWKRKSGAVANEDNLKKTGQGWDIIINEGYDLADCEKIIPSAVPQSDLALADQMKEMIFATSGIQMENWSGQEDKQISSLTVLLKQAANLMVFQKYFDQWDYSLKILGDRCLQIVMNNWSHEKVKLIINEDPSPFFYSKIFAKYQCTVEEGLMTPTQKQMQAQQLLDINTTFGREVVPPSMIIKDMNIQGKNELMEYLQQQEQQSSEMQQQQQILEQGFTNARMQELMSKASGNIALARERHSRSEANIGLFEERLSELEKNKSISLREKMKALQTLVETIQKYGEVETFLRQNNLEKMETVDDIDLDREKAEAKSGAAGNRFMSEIMGSMGNQMPQNTGVEETQMTETSV
jgi:hypothetical protein